MYKDFAKAEFSFDYHPLCLRLVRLCTPLTDKRFTGESNRVFRVVSPYFALRLNFR